MNPVFIFVFFAIGIALIVLANTAARSTGQKLAFACGGAAMIVLGFITIYYVFFAERIISML